MQRHFNDEIAAKMVGTVWASGCNSWYLADGGKNFAIWPDQTYRFVRRTRRFRLADYRVATAPARVVAAVAQPAAQTALNEVS